MFFVVLPLLSALATASFSILSRRYMRKGYDAYSIVAGNLLISGIVLALVWPPAIPAQNIFLVTALVIGSSLSWAGMCYFDLRAYKDLDAAVNALLQTGSFVMINLGAWLFFGERRSVLQIWGVVLIGWSILFGAGWRHAIKTKGLTYRGICVFLATIAWLMDKRLTQLITPESVLVIGYLFPGAILFLLKPRRTIDAAGLFWRQWRDLLPGLILYGIIGIGLILPMGYGQLWYTSAIFELRLALVFVLGWIILGERENALKRLFSILVASGGAALVILG